MKRINGFIDIESLLNWQRGNNYDSNYWGALISKLYDLESVNIIRCSPPLKLVFSFVYNGEVYYFKYDKEVNPYNELIAEEICHDLNIACVSYDLAIFGGLKGNISKDYKVSGAKYIDGHDILKGCMLYQNEINKQKLNSNYDEHAMVVKYNSLEGIRKALEERFQNCPDKNAILSYLMDQITKIFILDLLLGIYDRHDKNWQIVEFVDGGVSVQPVFDNARCLKADFPVKMASTINTEYFESDISWLKQIADFLEHAPEEYISLFEGSLWVLSKENFDNIRNSIMQKTGADMPLEDQNYFSAVFASYLEMHEMLIKSNGR